MYKLLLISKYLRRKLAPLFAAVAVTICTAMVIIVASVMGGFLGLMETTARQLTPDVVIQSPSLTGFEGYEDLIDRLEAEPEVALATPAIVSPASATFNGLSIPVTRQVFVQGIEPRDYDRIVPYRSTLLWDAQDMRDHYGFSRMTTPDEDIDIAEAGAGLVLPPIYQDTAGETVQPGATIGVALNPVQRRQDDGSYRFDDAFVGRTLTLGMPVFAKSGEAIDVSQPRIGVVNEIKSGFYETDSTAVYVPFEWLQKRLQMQRVVEYTEYDELTGLGGEPVVTEARCTHVYVKAADGVSDEALVAKARAVRDRFLIERASGEMLDVLTWEDVHGTLLGAVRNEKGLVTFLFAIISIVAIVMVATTFYMIVLEKTRDIGVLRAIGASSVGVLNLFLTYGLAIGVIGTAAGVWLAWFTVTNLNNLQAALAQRLGTLIGSVALAALAALVLAVAVALANRKRDFGLAAGVVVFLGGFVLLLAGVYYGFPSITLPVISGYDAQIGWKMWDPQLYFFEKIPDEVAWNEVLWIAIGAVVSSVIGAIIPAVIAARLNPVEALRYE